MRYATIAALAAAAFFAISPLRAQTPPASAAPPAENLAAARELVSVMKATDQFKALLPTIFENLKPIFVQGRPETAKDYDAITPIIMASALKRLDLFADKLAGVYAGNFSVNELHDLTAFYRSPTGQKLIERQPVLARASVAVAQEFAHSLVIDIRAEIGDELRKREQTK